MPDGQTPSGTSCGTSARSAWSRSTPTTGWSGPPVPPPSGEALWELPAGLIDVEGESLVHAAARELREEADLVAADWQLLSTSTPRPAARTR